VAVASIASIAYDAIVLDLGLPDRDGLGIAVETERDRVGAITKRLVWPILVCSIVDAYVRPLKSFMGCSTISAIADSPTLNAT
jgi:hypothetical protein